MQRPGLIILSAIFAAFISEKNFSGKHSNLKITVKQEESFLMPVDDVFSISGSGTVVTGTIERGTIRIGDSVEIVGLSGTTMRSKVKRIELFQQSPSEAKKGDKAGLLLSGVDQSQLQRGMVICKPRSIAAHIEFRCQLSLITRAEGGRSTPVSDKYRPLFALQTALITGVISLPAGKDQLQTGESALVSVTLTQPVAMENNMEFTIREGGKTVGTGKVIDIIK